MDPNASLSRIRALVREHAAAESNEHKAGIADELVDLIDSLDQWLSRGGFKPKPWSCYAAER
jgi:hypothetical protein